MPDVVLTLKTLEGMFTKLTYGSFSLSQLFIVHKTISKVSYSLPFDSFYVPSWLTFKFTKQMTKKIYKRALELSFWITKLFFFLSALKSGQLRMARRALEGMFTADYDSLFCTNCILKRLGGLRKIIKSCVMMWVQRVLWEVWGGYLSFPFIEFSDLSEFGRGDLKIAIYWHI